MSTILEKKKEFIKLALELGLLSATVGLNTVASNECILAESLDILRKFKKDRENGSLKSNNGEIV